MYFLLKPKNSVFDVAFAAIFPQTVIRTALLACHFKRDPNSLLYHGKNHQNKTREQSITAYAMFKPWSLFLLKTIG